MTRSQLLGAACALALLGLSSAAPLSAATPDNQLIIGMNLNNMLANDPHEVGQFEPGHVFANVYDMLVDTDAEDPAKVVPALAESWKINDDGSITFTLREGLKFHSGNPITAADVVWSIRRLMALNKSPSGELKEWGFTAENAGEVVTAIDARTVRFGQPKPINSQYRLYNLARPLGAVLDSKLLMEHEQNGDWGAAWLSKNSAGSGPFKLNRWQPNDIIILDRVDGYWGGDAKMRRVVIRHIPESQTQRLQLEQNDIDVGYTLSSADFEGLAKNPDVEIVKVPGGGFYYFGVSMKDPDLGKKEVRQALDYCIDYDGINKGIMTNYGIPWHNHVLQGLAGELPNTKHTFDVERCKADLAAAGYPNGMKKNLKVLSVPPFREIATAVQASLGKAGVEVDIEMGDGGQVYGAARNQAYEMIVGRSGSGYIPDPHDVLQSNVYYPADGDTAKYPNLTAWRASWHVPEITTLIEQALAENDNDKRRDMYVKIQELTAENVSWMYLISQRIDPFAIHKRVKNYDASATWRPRWELVEKS